MVSLLLFGLVAGGVFGALSVALMLPMSFSDKRTALLGAFADRFAIGFLVPWVSLPTPGWIRGLIVGLLISLPSAIVTKAYAPVLIVGSLGGAAIGWLTVALLH